MGGKVTTKAKFKLTAWQDPFSQRLGPRQVPRRASAVFLALTTRDVLGVATLLERVVLALACAPH